MNWHLDKSFLDMKKIVLVVLGLILFPGVYAQTGKSEGAHEAEFNARQNEVDGEEHSSKTLHDARNVNEINSEVSSDTVSTEENTPMAVTNGENLGSSTGPQKSATLNIAGSPVPGSRKQTSEASPAKKSKTTEVKAAKEEEKPEKRTAKPSSGKKKKKR